ncbi:MAG: sn-glycerol-3-phosphate ABC transporter ATP-binding protein UgpC [Elusimicrobiota bacterium]|jgi:multiple sugar transport system ATP-binding protein
MAKVVLDRIVKHYPGNDRCTVPELNLTIEDGEFLVLVGPSGCGKSTILRMIAGLIDATSGRVSLDGRDITGLPPKDRDISMVFQNYALFPHLTVYDNIAFGLKIRGAERSEIARRVNEAAELLDLKKVLDKKPRELSGGQRQRVALGRAIVRQPKVFLFDEPLSNLDAKLRTQMRAELAKLHRRLKATAIYVTHDQSEAMTLADRVVVLHAGAVAQCDTPLEIYSRPKNTFVAAFMGSPAMNLFDAVPIAQGGTMLLKARDLLIEPPADIVRLLRARKDEKYTLGIRPEQIYLADRKPAELRFGPVLDCEIELAESLGDEVCLHCDAGGLRFLATHKHDFAVKAGDRLSLVFAVDKLRIFDSAGDALA